MEPRIKIDPITSHAIVPAHGWAHLLGDVTSSGDHIMRNATQVANDYIALWNEMDPTLRKEALVNAWTPDATYADPVMQGKGQGEIDALIGAIYAKFPGFVFSLIAPADGHGSAVRFSWGLGPKGGEAVVKGTDS
jgi:hypothetical protein